MAKDRDNLAGDLGAESTGGLFTGFLAEEDEFDRRTLWRLGSWGFAAVGAVTLAVLANQSSLGWRRDAAAVTRQAQQIQMLNKESQNEARRLASAIETLNSDRDRLYARVTELEQGLDSVTGAITKQSAAAAPQPAPAPVPVSVQEPAAQPIPTPVLAPIAVTAPAAAAPERPAAEKPAALDKLVAVATEKPPAEKPPVVAADTPPATAPPAGNPDPANAAASSLPTMPLVAPTPMIGPPDPTASKPADSAKPAAVTASPMPEVVAAAPAAGDGEKVKEDVNAPKAEIQRTEFGVDLGTANSVPGLRALWRGLLKSRSNAPLFKLRPIIVIREGTNGLGMQLRLVAGPLRDAGAAAKICAVLAENGRACETAIFDGQRLTLKDEPPPATAAPAKPAPRRHATPKRAAVVVEEPPNKPEPPPAPSAVSTITSLFGRKEQ
ncbi:hypothetical protein I6F35_32040 [Bradyrhizobium sp. BRP22]|uniref:hypothetical protein n=1 Tax=Bradyrhizobium sp. BRP22 TaxID=2793821 RepID=UPI001CD2317F|nr:hypothetical protein [Bradyrhizobium sp. BRP22]MCA1457763.1 hypothetical protein [Bradyrhizobium sp. BRP22]